MPRDLFAGTFDRRPGPRRSGWTIAGSFVAHASLLAALLVLPVMSAFDNYVLQARNVTFIPPPPAVMPAMPVAPPKVVTKIPENVNPDFAPAKPPENPVTSEPSRADRSGPPGAFPIGDGRTPIPGGAERGVDVMPPAPPPPVPPKPVRPGGDVSAPKRLFYADPVYPQIAVAAKLEGMVILEATIDETGVVRDVKVLRSIAMLDQAAMDAVKRWRYTPTKLNGVPVPILLTVTVTFSLR